MIKRLGRKGSAFSVLLFLRRPSFMNREPYLFWNRFLLNRKVADSLFVDNIWVISSPKLIRSFLVKSSLFKHQSGFFRIGGSPLSEDRIKELNNEVRRLVSSCLIFESSELDSLLQRCFVRSPLTSRYLGFEIAYSIFREIILKDRPEYLSDFVERYVYRSIIPKEVWAIKKSGEFEISRLREEISTYLKLTSSRDEVSDLLDVAILSSDSPEEQAEIFQRLVLAVVGFTGCTVEWIFISLGKYGSSAEPRDFVLEVMRYYSPIWRLTRTIFNQGKVSLFDFHQDDELIFNLFASSRSSLFGDSTSTFNPNRWASGEVDDRFIFFFWRR